MSEANGSNLWPTPSGERDLASFCRRLVRPGRPLAPFEDRGRLLFVTADPDVIASVLRNRDQLYHGVEHPYRAIDALYAPGGRFLLGFDRDANDAREALAAIHRIAAEETVENAREWARRCAAGDGVSLLPAARELLLRIITRVLFDVDAGTWSASFVKAAAFVEAWQALVGVHGPHPALPRYLEAVELQHRTAATIVRERSGGRAAQGGDDLRTSVIETLMNGYVGLAATVSWVLLELSSRAAIASAITAEIDRSAEDGPKQQGTAGLPLTRQLVLECMRLHPVAWTLGRRAAQAHQLRGQFVPAGAVVLCCTYALHRNGAVWHAPDDFILSRFAPGSGARRHTHAFLAFGAGANACPAQHIAPLMLQTIVAELLRRYDVRVEADGGIRNRTLISLMPHPSPWLRLEPRRTQGRVTP
jgi:cytochrome P450